MFILQGIPPPPTPLSKVATLGDGSDGWTKLDKVFRQFDEGRIQDCKEDMDTLLVFVGYFPGSFKSYVPLTASNRLVFSLQS